jgi:hypothetical protein
MSGAAFLVAIILLAAGGAIIAYSWDERLRVDEDARKERRLLSELARHPSSNGTAFCPYCRETVGRCLCD